ncbi:hypothetical protein SUDANB120_05909 [Streptomyces sp. enrichment culture]|uniref:effector-associated constant component EACC1 n=1 Tax=Streptomyces TaxID=1883 RepID=UPI00167555F0|nr:MULTISPECIES: hypothetical protein [Streptomyces]MBD3579538.1 hypothetical protein [Streptomyces sp. KD18]GGT23367.1 hypothetical protein GCM10010286_56060 [Streptomyces toxytricini]
MDIRIDVPGDDAALEELAAWLRAERVLRGRVKLRSAPPQAGTMGSDTELVLQLAELGMAVLVAVLQSVDLWLSQRPTRRGGGPGVRVTRPDGAVFDFGGGPAEVERLVAALSPHLGGEGSGDADGEGGHEPAA